MIAAETGIGKDSVVLDAGSGSGALALYLANIAKKVVTCEVKEEHYEIVRQNIEFMGFNNITQIKQSIYDPIEKWGGEKLEKDAPESDKREMAQVSPLLERIEDLVNGEPEMPSTTIETAVETMNEYIKALNVFSEDQLEAFLMGVGANWLNLPYWGVPGLKFQCKKIEDWLIKHKDLESKGSEQKRRTYEKRNPYNALPFYNHSRKLLHSEILANALSFFESMLQVLSTRSF